MLILVAIALLLKTQSRLTAWNLRFQARGGTRRLAWAITSGMVLGFLVGLTSVGSGSLFGVLMLVVFGLSSREMVGTDVFHAAILTSAATVGEVFAGNINYALVGNLLIGSIPGVLFGSKLAARMPEKALRPVLAGVLLLSGLKML
jgi:uncharacterized membrane protein YfcA